MKPNVKWRYSVWIRLLYIIIFVIVLGELFFNNYSFFRIPTTSMEPTLFPGDRVLVTNFITGDIVHNDVILYNMQTCTTCLFIYNRFKELFFFMYFRFQKRVQR